LSPVLCSPVSLVTCVVCGCSYTLCLVPSREWHCGPVPEQPLSKCSRMHWWVICVSLWLQDRFLRPYLCQM